MVIYVVSLENYKQLNKNGFRVICDYSEVSGNQTFLIPELVEKPKEVTSSRLNINKVQLSFDFTINNWKYNLNKTLKQIIK